MQKVFLSKFIVSAVIIFREWEPEARSQIEIHVDNVDDGRD